MIKYSFENTFKIYLIRHGQSEANLRPDNISADDINSPLTAYGHEQAKKLGEYFKKNSFVFDKVYSSTLDRAKNTAKICLATLNSHQEIVESNSIIEWNPGSMNEDLNNNNYSNELKLNNNTLIFNQSNWFLPENGESFHMVKERVGHWFNTEIVYNPEHKNKNLSFAIFSHGVAISAILMNIMNFDERFIKNIEIENTGICYIEYSKYGWKIHTINDTRHLV
jgi:broad specificity phosphatase PhoE